MGYGGFGKGGFSKGGYGKGAVGAFGPGAGFPPSFPPMPAFVGYPGMGKGGELAPEPQEDALSVAIREAMEPVAHMDTTWSCEEICSRVSKYMWKSIAKYQKDERIKQKGSPVQAQAFLEEFVDAAMGSISAACYDKAWFPEANFAGPLYEASLSICKGQKLFCRVLSPCLQRYVEEGLFRFREEERIQKGFYDAISGTGLPESYHKKANQHLQKSYDEAHTTAPIGSSSAEDPSMQLLKDFVVGWMRDFIGRSYDIRENGVSPESDQQMIFVTALFQQLVGPELRCLPIELVSEFGKPETAEVLPDAGWGFIAEQTESIFAEIDAQLASRPTKMPRKGGYKGF